MARTRKTYPSFLKSIIDLFPEDEPPEPPNEKCPLPEDPPKQPADDESAGSFISGKKGGNV